MSRSFYRNLFWSVAVCLLVMIGLNVPSAQAQQGTVGTVAVTVVEPKWRGSIGREIGTSRSGHKRRACRSDPGQGQL